VAIAGVRRSGLAAWLTAPFKLIWAVLQALAAFRRWRPAAVLGMGGFVSGPGGLAAWLTRKPLIIHEQNAVAGTANRMLLRFAARVYEAFPDSFPTGSRVHTIGNPLRRSIVALTESLPGPRRVEGRAPRLLVLGGSQGALVLNELVPAALAALAPEARPLVRHQAGRTLEQARQAYARAGADAEIVDFIDDMAAAYAWADLVIARAGALTLSELAAAGLGAILVPLPTAVDDHQRRNAEHFAAGGAGIVLEQSGLDGAALAAELARLMAEPTLIERMSAAARKLARPAAARELADACIELAEAAA
jgi:UDP-N-acetylglucosamine--N-acetylmuramyl-(pentapeptide) pyrophosphoryl-undecaprenol N-acetylglucosamine transferase